MEVDFCGFGPYVSYQFAVVRCQQLVAHGLRHLFEQIGLIHRIGIEVILDVLFVPCGFNLLLKLVEGADVGLTLVVAPRDLPCLCPG